MIGFLLPRKTMEVTDGFVLLTTNSCARRTPAFKKIQEKKMAVELIKTNPVLIVTTAKSIPILPRPNALFVKKKSLQSVCLITSSTFIMGASISRVKSGGVRTAKSTQKMVLNSTLLPNIQMQLASVLLLVASCGLTTLDVYGSTIKSTITTQ